MELDTRDMGRTVPSRKKSDNSWKQFKSSDVILNPDRRSDADPLYLYRFHIFVCETKRCNSYEWYIGSKDWKDGRKCRKCTVSVMPCETFLGLTPYQGDLRVFGLFRCQKCRRYWKSAYSWANTPQECETCEIDVYPYKQCYLSWTNNREELQKTEQSRVKGGHQIRLCEVCRSNTAAGGNCLCILRDPQSGFRQRHSDGRSSVGTTSSGVSSAENVNEVNEDVEEVIEISLKSIEEAEAEKQKRLRTQRRRLFYNYMRRPPRLQGKIARAHSSGFARGRQRRLQSAQSKPRQRPQLQPKPQQTQQIQRSPSPLPRYSHYECLETTSPTIVMPPPPPIYQRPELRRNICRTSEFPEFRPRIIYDERYEIAENRPTLHPRPRYEFPENIPNNYNERYEISENRPRIHRSYEFPESLPNIYDDGYEIREDRSGIHQWHEFPESRSNFHRRHDFLENMPSHLYQRREMPEMSPNFYHRSEVIHVVHHKPDVTPSLHRRPEMRPVVQHNSPHMGPGIQRSPEMRPNIRYNSEMRLGNHQRSQMRFPVHPKRHEISPRMQQKRLMRTFQDQAPPMPPQQPVSRILNNPTVVPSKVDYSNIDAGSKSQVELLYDKMKLLMV